MADDEIVLARWECGHTISQRATRITGDRGMMSCPYCAIVALESQLASLQERDAKDAADALTGSMAHRTESMVKLTRRIAARASETPK